MTWYRQAFQLEIIHIDVEITFQKSRIRFFQLGDFLFTASQVARRLAVLVFELPDVLRHQGAIGVVINLAGRRVIRQWVQLAAEWLGVAQRATGGAKVQTLGLDANAAKASLFFRGQ